VHHRNSASLIKVRVGIFVRGRAVRGPASMANSKTTLDRVLLQRAGKTFVDFAFFLSDHQVRSVDDRHAGAVITAVFKPPQALKQNGRRRFLTDVSDNATHIFELYIVRFGDDKQFKVHPHPYWKKYRAFPGGGCKKKNFDGD
jgi:hypothetical protein